jgi:hypothetical protein
MTRAYIKLDPNFPDRKDYYPDGPWRALVTLFCYASHQPTPGVFKSERLMKVMLGRHARHVAFLLKERDLVPGRDGSLLVVGWKEWQEGNFPSVSARIDAIEKRRRALSPADRAFLYRQRKRDALRDASQDHSGNTPDTEDGDRDDSGDASRDGDRDGKSNATLRNFDETQLDKPRNAARLKEREDGTFEVVTA